MIRIIAHILIINLLLVIISSASEPVVVLLYGTAIWGPYCKHTENACAQILKELGEEAFCPLALHIGDEFYTSAIDPMLEQYKFSYVPAPIVDGSYDSSRGTDYDALLPVVEERLTVEREITISVEGEISDGGGKVNVVVRIQPDEEIKGEKTLVIFLREDNVYLTGVTHQFICRDLYIQNIQLEPPTADAPFTLEHQFMLEDNWDLNNLSVGAFVQDFNKPLQEYSVYNGAFDGGL